MASASRNQLYVLNRAGCLQLVPPGTAEPTTSQEADTAIKQSIAQQQTQASKGVPSQV